MLDFPQLFTDNPLNAGCFFSTIYKNVSFKFVCFVFFQFSFNLIEFSFKLIEFSFNLNFQNSASWSSFIPVIYLLSLHRQCWTTNQNVNEGLCTTSVSRFKRTFFVKEKALRPCRKAFAWNVIRPRSPRYRQYTCDLLYFDIYVCVDLLPWTLLKL